MKLMKLMKLTITQEDNDAANAMVDIDVLTHCPTAIAFCRQTGRKIGSVHVGYGEIFSEFTTNPCGRHKSLAHFEGNLLKDVKNWTRVRTAILGTFDIELS